MLVLRNLLLPSFVHNSGPYAELIILSEKCLHCFFCQYKVIRLGMITNKTNNHKH